MVSDANSSFFEELESIACCVMNDVELKNFLKYVRDASMDGFNIHEWDASMDEIKEIEKSMY